MAWPPAALPTNRTNSTPQNITHPADHNAISAAINDIVGWGVNVVTPAALVRQGFGATQSGQAVGAGVTAVLAWNTVAWQQGGAWIAPGQSTHTVPAGAGGVYGISVTVSTNFPVSALSWVLINIAGGTTRAMALPATGSGITLTTLVTLAAGAQFSVSVYNGNSGSLFWAGALDVQRLVA